MPTTLTVVAEGEGNGSGDDEGDDRTPESLLVVADFWLEEEVERSEVAELKPSLDNPADGAQPGCVDGDAARRVRETDDEERVREHIEGKPDRGQDCVPDRVGDRLTARTVKPVLAQGRDVEQDAARREDGGNERELGGDRTP
jgi:hypothetical protein